MAVRLELFATGVAPPEDTWAVVGDPWRLPEWTDVERVESIEPTPLEVGARVAVVAADGRLRQWQVTTVAPRLLEAATDTDQGRLELGVRVLRDPHGSRVVLAGAFEAASAVGRARVRLVDAPALRRRFDRWTRTALDLAASVR